MGKSAEGHDIENSCSCEPTADQKVCNFQRYIQKPAENAFFFVIVVNFNF